MTMQKKRMTIAVAGNPNCGKTTLFNELTGSRQMVGNWPGVTVDRKSGVYAFEGHDFELIDIPGIYALSAHSTDEKVARDFLLSSEYDLIVNIVDAANVQRNLYLTTQLLEMRVPMIVVLNKIDVAQDRQIAIDEKELSNRLGVPVIPVSATKRNGVEPLKKAIHKCAEHNPVSEADVVYPVEIQEAATALVPCVSELAATHGIKADWLAMKVLEEDPEYSRQLDDKSAATVAHEQEKIEAALDEEADIAIADARYGFIHWLTEDVVVQKTKVARTLTDKIDKIVLNRLLGLPIFLGMMYLVFMFTINVGGAFIDFFDIATGAFFVDGMAQLLGSVGAPQWVIGVVANGIGAGVQTVATFIPPIGFMFLALAVLEGSGYMARAAFVMDRFMRMLGLPGKSFVPMLVGFGCNVPAIMATRTLENERDRTLTITMNPFMSCGARLPVYALFAAAFFPSGGQNMVFLLYLAGIGFAVLTGKILKHTLLKGEITPFVMELPPYHVPTCKSVLLRTWERLKSFLTKATRILIPMVAILAMLNTLSPDGSIGHDDSKTSVLASVSRAVTPVFAPMGIQQDNWPATVGIFTGVLAKEAVVGTLDSLYQQNESAAAFAAGEEETFHLGKTLKSALTVTGENLRDLGSAFTDPLGVNVGDTSSVEAAAAEQGVQTGTFGVMVHLFDGKIGAGAYLLFVLMYFPCVAAMAAIYRETTRGWTLFVALWTTGLAYLAATNFYQLATFAEHPTFSTLWLTGSILFFGSTVAFMRYKGQQRYIHTSPVTDKV